MAYITKQQVQDIIIKGQSSGLNPDQVIDGLVGRGHSIEGLNDTPQSAVTNSVKYVRKPVNFMGDLKEIGNATVALGKEALVGAGSLPARAVGGLATLITGKPDLAKRISANVEAFSEQLKTQKNLDAADLDATQQRKLVNAGRMLGEIGITLPIGVGNVAKAATLGTKVLQGAKTGAAMGGGFGLTGEAETRSDVLGNVGVGAGMGAVVGAAAPTIAAGVQKAIPVVRKLASKVPSAIKSTAQPGIKTSGYIRSRGPKALAILTGEDLDAVTAALKNPQAADIGIKGGDEALRKAVKTAGEKSIHIKSQFVKTYADAKKKLLGSLASKNIITKNNLVGELNSVLKSHGVTIKGGQLDFSTSNIKANPGEISKLKAAYESIRNWSDKTVSGIDDLKQHIGKLTRFADEAGVPSKSPALGEFYHRLDTIIKKRLPDNLSKQYTELNSKFSSSIDLFDDMVEAFNSGDPFTKVAGAFGKNKDVLRNIIKFYGEQTGEDLTAIMAGRELSMEKQAAFGLLNPRSWIDLIFSPSGQAKFISWLGKTSQKTGGKAKIVPKIPAK